MVIPTHFSATTDGRGLSGLLHRSSPGYVSHTFVTHRFCALADQSNLDMMKDENFLIVSFLSWLFIICFIHAIRQLGK